MLTVTSKSRPGSSLRLLTLLAIAHATLAFYLWLCAFDINLVLTSVHLWQFLCGLWLVWPVLAAVRVAPSVARFVRGALRAKPAFNADVRAALRTRPRTAAPLAGQRNPGQ
jgi:hypothetical protein